MNTEIIFFHSLICPRCIRVRRLLNKLRKNYPELSITKVGSLTKVLRREIYTLPAIQIGETILYGKEITEKQIKAELGLF